MHMSPNAVLIEPIGKKNKTISLQLLEKKTYDKLY